VLLGGACASDTNRPFVASCLLGVLPAVVLGWHLSVTVPRRDSQRQQHLIATAAMRAELSTISRELLSHDFLVAFGKNVNAALLMLDKVAERFRAEWVRNGHSLTRAEGLLMNEVWMKLSLLGPTIGCAVQEGGDRWAVFNEHCAPVGKLLARASNVLTFGEEETDRLEARQRKADESPSPEQVAGDELGSVALHPDAEV